MTNVFYQIGLLMMVSLLLLFFLAWLIYRDNKDKTEFEKNSNNSHQDTPDPNKYVEENY
jgi:hypothetical protein